MDFLWYEKYRPAKFSELTYHDKISYQLENLSSSKNMPHIIFYGPDGSGKTTRMNCLLQHLYGQNLGILKQDTYRMKHKSTLIELPIQYSRNHVELCPSDLKQRDSLLLNKFIKDCATNQSLIFDGEKKGNFLTIILYKAEKLSLTAQAALRRSLEKYSEKIRVIMICQSTGSLIPAIKSRCLLMRIPSPSEEEVFEVLKDICRQEAVKDNELIKFISQNCNRNLRAGLLMLQKAKVTQIFDPKNFSEKWKELIKNSIELILTKQDPKTIKDLRKIYYDLLCNNIPADEIIKELLVVFLDNLKNNERQTALKAKQFAMENHLVQNQ